MRTLWFIVPVHERLRLAKICLTQLRRTCDALTEEGIAATAVVISDGRTLRAMKKTIDQCRFGRVTRDNRFLSRRFNDGIQAACDRRFNRLYPADYVVPIGSDDWIDHRVLLDLPPANTIVGFQHMSFVREDGRELVARHLDYRGGCGIRIYPRQILAPLRFRPADEHRARGCDTSILTNIFKRVNGVRVEHRETSPLQIVDWKTRGTQLNSSEALRRHKAEFRAEPFEALRDIFPPEALDAMRRHYGREKIRARSL